MANEYRVSHIEHVEQTGEVVGIRVHVVTVPGLSGTTVGTAVVGDYAIALKSKIEHLRVPRVSVERPSVRKDDWLTLSPILKEYPCPIFGCMETAAIAHQGLLAGRRTLSSGTRR
jgi:hypothetical protein